MLVTFSVLLLKYCVTLDKSVHLSASGTYHTRYLQGLIRAFIMEHNETISVNCLEIILVVVGAIQWKVVHKCNALRRGTAQAKLHNLLHVYLKYQK